MDLLKTLEEKLSEKNEKKRTLNSELQKEEKKNDSSHLKLLREDLKGVFIASEIFKNPFI